MKPYSSLFKFSLVLISLAVIFFIRPEHSLAADNNFVTPVFPVRGRDYWRTRGDIKNLLLFKDIVIKSNLPATWLIHYDILQDPEVLEEIKSLPENQEIGLFLEVTRELADDSTIFFDWHTHWSAASNVFLSGYTLEERRLLIDQAFESFKSEFGYYPKSYGSWYTDVYSMEYIKDKYTASINLGLADQYSTDGYQSWGQYINQPYFASRYSAIEPALQADNTGVLKVLWAPRDPLLSFGNSVDQSNFSLQLNDYSRGKGLPHQYFHDLLRDLTLNVQGKAAGVVVGLEVGEVDPELLVELENQLNTLNDLQNQGLRVETLSGFNNAFRNITTQNISTLTVREMDGHKAYWYTTPSYRAGIFVDEQNVTLKDLRFYHQNHWLDNDYSQTDPRQNLHRLVPAVVDSVSLDNPIVLGASADFSVEFTKDTLTTIVDNQQYHFTPEKIIFADNLPEAILNSPLVTVVDSGNAIIGRVNDSNPVSFRPCFTESGGPNTKNPCATQFKDKLIHFLPDIVYSSINERRYFGLRISKTSIFGIRFPEIKLGKLNFDFETLHNFLSLRNKLKPRYTWYGKQEYEVRDYDKVLEKDSEYGQENILEQVDDPVIFENGYYLVTKSTTID